MPPKRKQVITQGETSKRGRPKKMKADSDEELEEIPEPKIDMSIFAEFVRLVEYRFENELINVDTLFYHSIILVKRSSQS